MRNHPTILLPSIFFIGIAAAAPLPAETIKPEDFFKQQIVLAESNHRYDIAEAALEHWLAIDKSNPEALFFQARLNILKGDNESAKKNILNFEAQYPNHPELNKLKTLFETFSSKKLQLQQANFLMGNRRYDEAIAIYESLFPYGMPTTAIEIDYLTLIAKRSTVDFDRAVKLLKERNTQYPNNPEFKLALAAVISQKTPDDKASLIVYEQLSHDEVYKSKAATVWKSALSDVPIEKLTTQEIDELARAYPEDLSVKTKVVELKTALASYQQMISDPAYQAMLKGFEFLKVNKIDLAEQKFAYVKNVHLDNPQVYNGLGRVRMNQSKYAEAIALFQQGKKIDSNRNNDDEWDSLISTSQYWMLINRASKVAETNQAVAMAMYKKAIHLNPKEVYPYIALGKILAKNKILDEADAFFVQALQLENDNREALLGRVNLRADNNKIHEALALAEKFTAAQKKLIADDLAALKINVFVNDSETALNNHDLETANEKMDAALSLKTLNPWLTYQAAGVLNQLNRKNDAEKFIQQLVANISPSSDSHFASSLYLAKQNKLQEALAEMDKIAPTERTPSVIQNQQRIWLEYQLSVLESLLKLDKQKASELLTSIESEVANDVDLRLKLANYWLDLEDITHSKSIMDALNRDEKWSLNTTLIYAELLFNLKDFEKLAALEKTIDLSTASTQAQLQYGKLMLKYKTLQAKQYLEAGNKIAANQLYFSILQQDPLFISIYQNLAKFSDNMSDEKAKALTVSWVENHINELANSDAYSDFPVIRKIQMLAKYEQLETSEKMLQDMLADKTNEDRALYDASKIALTLKKWDIAEQLSYAALAKNKMKINVQPETVSAENKAIEFNKIDKKQLYQTTDDDWLAKNVKSNIDELRKKTDGYVSVSTDYGFGTTTTGMGIPIEAKIPIQKLGHLTFRTDPIAVDAGKQDLSQLSNAKDYGSSLLCFPNCGQSQAAMDAKGAGYNVGWIGKNWKMDIGRTPENFLVTDVVGGLRIDGDIDAVSWAVNVAKRPLTNSTLSYAGLIDPNTKKIWGGARQTGVSVSLGFDNGSPVGVWSSWQYHQITGKNIEDNTKLMAMIGTYWSAWKSADNLINIDFGLNSLYMKYAHNLSQLTLGHGGYYSPQSYASLSLPATVFGRYDTWSYSVRVSGAYSFAKVDDAPYFPNNPDLQALAEERQAVTGVNPIYIGSTSQGSSYSINSIIEKRLTNHWSMGARMQVQRSPFYSPSNVGLFLKYDFNEHWSPIETPPRAPNTYADT